MRVAITGGAGFIGTAVISYLLDNTSHTVINLDKLTYASVKASSNEFFKNKRYVFLKADVCDFSILREIFELQRPDMVLHLAAETHVDTSISDPQSFVDANVLGTYSLLEATRSYWSTLKGKASEQFRFLHVSTDEVFGDLAFGEKPASEDHTYIPSSPYSATKACSDHLVQAWGRTYRLPVIISRSSNNYGPYQFPEKLIPHVILSAIRGKRIPIYGDGMQIRDWLFVEDHARALVTILSEGSVGHSYNVSASHEQKNIDVVHTICDFLEELAPSKPSGVRHYRDLIEFVNDRPGHDRRYALDTSKIEMELGWFPEKSFKKGLLSTVKWYLENNSWWRDILCTEEKFNQGSN